MNEKKVESLKTCPVCSGRMGIMDTNCHQECLECNAVFDAVVEERTIEDVGTLVRE